MAKIVKLQAKQTVNNTLYHYNRLNTILVYNLLLNFKVLIQYENSNWTRPYCLLAVKNKICCIQLLNGLISFRSISVKSYFQSKDTYDIKLDKLEVTAKLDKLEVTTELDKLKVIAKLDKLETPLFTLKVPQKLTEPAKPTIKCG